MKLHYINYFKTIKQFAKKRKIIIGYKTKIKTEKNVKIETHNVLILNHTQFPTLFFKNSLLYMFKNSKLITFGNEKTRVYSGFIFDIRDDAVLKIGGGTTINRDVSIYCFKHIEIGCNCLIGPGVKIRDGDGHSINGKSNFKDVIIGNHVWIGENVLILKGVKIGDNAIIGAGSIVTKNVPNNSIVAGNPASIIRNNIEWN